MFVWPSLTFQLRIQKRFSRKYDFETLYNSLLDPSLNLWVYLTSELLSKQNYALKVVVANRRIWLNHKHTKIIYYWKSILFLSTEISSIRKIYYTRLWLFSDFWLPLCLKEVFFSTRILAFIFIIWNVREVWKAYYCSIFYYVLKIQEISLGYQVE